MYNHQEYIERNKPSIDNINVGDWIVLLKPGGVEQVVLKATNINNETITYLTCYGNEGSAPRSWFKKWEPKTGELCAFTDEIDSVFVVVGKLKKINTETNMYKIHSYSHLEYNYCLPLEYLIELRNKTK